MLSRKDIDTYYINPALLSYLVNGMYPPTRQVTHSVISGIQELNKRELIHIEKSENQHDWIINTGKLDSNKSSNNFYTTIEETSIIVILNSNSKHYGNTLSMLRFYIYLMSTLHKKSGDKQGVGFTKLDDISVVTGLNKKTISTYMDKLQELKLIYTYHPQKTIVFNSGELRELTSTYGSFCDSKKIISVGKLHENEFGSDIQDKFKKVNRQEGSKTRGLSQKFNYMCKCIHDGKQNPYAYDECKDIYETMLNFNKKYKDEPDRIKDLRVFSTFDFYKE